MNNFLQQLLGMQNFNFQKGVGSRVTQGYSDPQSLDNIVNTMRTDEMSRLRAEQEAKRQAAIPRTADTQRIVSFKPPKGEKSIMPDQAYRDEKGNYYEFDPKAVETARKYSEIAAKWAATVDPGSTYRANPEIAKENAKFVKDYVYNLMLYAPKYKMDPEIMAAIAMAESGWGGTRQKMNLSGYGIMGQLDAAPDKNLNYTFDAPTFTQGIENALTEYAKGYSGLTTPEQFAGPGRWNTNRAGDGDPLWLGNVKSIMGTLAGY